MGQFAVSAVDHTAQFARVDEEHFAAPVTPGWQTQLAAGRVAVSRQEPETGWDLSGIEELARQRHHAVHQIRFDQALADISLARLVRRHRAVGKNKAGCAFGREVMDDVLHPSEVGVALGWDAVLPALVVGELRASPIGNIEWRIGEDEVRLEVGVAVIVEGVAVSNLTFDTSNGEVHFGKPPGRVVRFLAVDGDSLGAPWYFPAIAVTGSVGSDEFD